MGKKQKTAEMLEELEEEIMEKLQKSIIDMVKNMKCVRALERVHRFVQYIYITFS